MLGPITSANEQFIYGLASWPHSSCMEACVGLGAPAWQALLMKNSCVISPWLSAYT